jgi:hypothetical protein
VRVSRSAEEIHVFDSGPAMRKTHAPARKDCLFFSVGEASGGAKTLFSRHFRLGMLPAGEFRNARPSDGAFSRLDRRKSMKRFSWLYLGALTGALVCLAPPASRADEYDKKTVVTIDQRTEVPGIVLEPGTYVIKLLNSSSNRHIAEIMNERMDHLYALTFTVAAEKITRTGKTVLTFYEGSNDRPPALRKWFWPGDTIGQEFVYPKDQAARIAAATKEKVPEGDLPTIAQSGQSLTPDNAKQLSSDVTEQKAPEASLDARAAEPPSPEPARSSESSVSVIAQKTPPPAPQQRADEERTPDSVVAASSDTPPETASSTSPDTTLPQTASYAPLIGIIGIVSFTLALSVAAIRRQRSL